MRRRRVFLRTRTVAGILAAAAVTLAPPTGADTLVEQVLADPPTTIASSAVDHGFELVGHEPLGPRGNNAALALAGDCVYVGNRGFDDEPVLVVDVSDPSDPRVAGRIDDTAVPGATSRELRTSPGNHLLVVMTYSETIGRQTNRNMLRLYDVSDCRDPVPMTHLELGSIRPHEFFLWEDPLRPGRVLAYVTTPFGPPQLVVADLSDPSAPTVVTAWEGLYPQPVGAEAENSGVASYLHSLSVSPDGRTGYLAYWDAGYYTIDTSQIADDLPAPVVVGAIPVQQAAGTGTGYTFRAPEDDDPVKLVNRGNTHTAVPLPPRDGRRLVALTDEAYDAAGECPYGWFHLVDHTDPLRPHVVSEYRLEQNTVEWCDANRVVERDDDYIVAPYPTHDATWSSHNLTVTDNLALVAWHAGGLQAIDTSDPTTLTQAGSWTPEPVPCHEDPCRAIRRAQLQEYLGEHPVLVWSYPVIADGLVYVVDIRNGLYVLRYTGPRAEEIAGTAFAEGNSNVVSRTIVAAPPGAVSEVAPGRSVVADLPQPDLRAQMRTSLGLLP